MYTTWKVDGTTPISLGLSRPLTKLPFWAPKVSPLSFRFPSARFFRFLIPDSIPPSLPTKHWTQIFKKYVRFLMNRIVFIFEKNIDLFCSRFKIESKFKPTCMISQGFCLHSHLPRLVSDAQFRMGFPSVSPAVKAIFVLGWNEMELRVMQLDFRQIMVNLKRHMVDLAWHCV